MRRSPACQLSCRIALWLLAALALSSGVAAEPLQVAGAYYFADTPFPEYTPLFSEGWSLRDAEGEPVDYAAKTLPLGGYVFVYLRNTTSKPVKPIDMAVDGVKLSEGLGVDEPPKAPSDHFRMSIYMPDVPKRLAEKLEAAGAPVWWKSEPATIQPGQTGEIVLRLRRDPKDKNLAISVIADGSVTDVSVSTKADPQPRFATVAFAPNLDAVYLYARNPKEPGAVPRSVFMDSQDVTSRCRIAADANAGIAAIVLKLEKPLDWLSHHSFRALYPDGSAATAVLRAWGREIVFGMWGGKAYPGTEEESAKKHLADLQRHNVNDVMDFVGKGKDWLYSQAGWDYCKSIGMGRMSNYPDQEGDPTFYFIYDEPDASDFNTPEVPAHLRLGSMGMYCVKWADVLRRKGPKSPVLLNIDNTYKPENWYMYHQIPDIPCIDPYYQGELDLCYMTRASRYPAHAKPTYVYAAATISQSACQPRPLHVLICTTRYTDKDKGYVGRFPTPEEERIQVYYAIAAGAKGLSHWWFSYDPGCMGCGLDDPAAQALWDEVGRVGAEVRTAGDVITASCPAALPVTTTRNIWARTLVSGLDTAALIVVNNNVICDRVGTVVQPLANAKVTVAMPSWLNPTEAFEVTCDGVKDITWKCEEGKAAVDLGTVNVSRFVIFTSDSGMRSRLQKLYDTKFAANVKSLVR